MQLLAKKDQKHKVHNVTIWLTGTLAAILLGTVIISAFMH